jgi:lipid-A-disaccharide synthase
LSLRLLLSCGESSGDLYAGALTRELMALVPGATVSGMGGPQLAAAGGEVIADYRGLSVTGLTEAIAKVPQSIRTLRRLVESARTTGPDAVVVIDFPDFNFPLARRIKKLGIPVVYYISPQVWAWRRGRLRTIRALADRVLVIFPFEEAIYRDAGIPVEFVGHPLIDLVKVREPRDAFLQRLGLRADAPTVALLPGSRANEVQRILPDLARAVPLIRAAVPAAQFVVARAPGLDEALFAVVKDLQAPVAMIEGDTDTVLAAADAAVTASGTATVQAAIHGVPMVIVYRLSPTTFHLARRLVTVDTVGMVNLIAGERIATELIQDALTPAAVAGETLAILTDPARSADTRRRLGTVRERLGAPGASRRAAAAIVQIAAGERVP